MFTSLIAVGVLTLGSAPSGQARDDGPCPADSPAIIPGSDYRADFWYDPSGNAYAWSAEEDECLQSLQSVTPVISYYPPGNAERVWTLPATR